MLNPAQREELEKLRKEQNPGKFQERPQQEHGPRPLQLPLEERLPEQNPTTESSTNYSSISMYQ